MKPLNCPSFEFDEIFKPDPIKEGWRRCGFLEGVEVSWYKLRAWKDWVEGKGTPLKDLFSKLG